MAGKLYGVGVGPGDPELMTIKACKIIRNCPVIAVPGRAPEETVAYQIAAGAEPAVREKELLGIHMPMTKNPKILEESHRAAVEKLKEELDAGKDVAFLTLGDPTVYSTYLYVHQELREAGYQTEIVSGIPSFCAAAARVQMGIGEKAEQIHIVPASYQIQEALELPGTKILMKAGRQYGKVKEQLLSADVDVVMVENCGMEGERIFHSAEEMPEEAGYYTLIFVKDKRERA